MLHYVNDKHQKIVYCHKIINHGVLVPFPCPPVPTQLGQAGPPQEADIITLDYNVYQNQNTSRYEDPDL